MIPGKGSGGKNPKVTNQCFDQYQDRGLTEQHTIIAMAY
jgi:hypothetical protein